MTIADLCPASLDAVFGPKVDACRRAFDFTLLFEESILSIPLSSLFLLIAFLRIYALVSKKRVVGGWSLMIAKLIVIVAVAALEIALLALWSLDRTERTSTTIAAATLSLVSALVLLVLSYYEHTHTIQPSALINVYLILSLLLDLPRARSLWLMGVSPKVSRVFSAALALRFLILGLESSHKSNYLLLDNREYAPEDTTGVISQTLFFWMNKLIYSGYYKPISPEDMYPLPVVISNDSLEPQLWRSWSKESKKGKHPLIWSVLEAFKWQFIQPIFPRLCLIGLTVSQPLLLLRMIQFLDDTVEGKGNESIGYGFLGAYAIVFLSVAVATAWYWHHTYRLITMIRGSLVLAIYNKTIELDTSALDNSAAVTLMSADVERISNGLRTLHETWANTIQVAIASWLLYTQIGLAFIAPLIVAVVCGLVTTKIGKAAGKQQTGWMGRIQARIDLTTNMLSAMKGVKMSGLTENMTSNIHNLRLEELDATAKFRWYQVYSALLAFTPVLISPLLALAIHAAVTRSKNQSMGAGTVFTALSLMTIISQPLSFLFQSIPNLMAAVACFDRIQKFLLAETRRDYRTSVSTVANVESTQSEKENLEIKTSSQLVDDLILLHPCGSAAINIRKGSFAWKESSRPTLHDINLTVRNSHLTMIIGPVGSGKTTLLKAFLGEVPTSTGMISIASTNVAFCDQTPWLTNKTLRENIIGYSKFDSAWYSTVLNACTLDEDLISLPNGDHSKLGSKGIVLSGGQKQRVALARAVYAREDILILDDIFSGLDSSTESLLFARLFGPEGLLRSQQRTVVLATHSVHFLPYADHIIVLVDGTVVDQGPFEELTVKNSYVRSLEIQRSKKKFKIGDHQRSVYLLTEPKYEPSIKDRDGRDGDIKVWNYYFQAIGTGVTIIFFIFVALYAFFYVFPLIWVKWWVEASDKNPNYGIGRYIGIYALLQCLGLIALAFMMKHSFITLVVSSGKSIHWKLLKTTMSAPMSFFDKTDSGTTLKRFGQDLQIIDAELPMAFMNMACTTFIMIGQVFLIINASYYLALSFPVIIALVYVLQKLYLRTSRQLRLIDLGAKAPLYSHFIESLSGLATIRAFGWRDDVKQLNRQLLDNSQRPFYLLQCIQRWLTLVLDLFATGFALLVVGLVLNFRHSVDTAFTAIALLNLMSLSAILMGVVTVWTQVETSIASIARVKSFEEDTPSEDLPGEDEWPPKNWPMKGEIEFQAVEASYSATSGKALNDISVSIKAGEKIGICGRTGSGKSSLMLVLFRMLEIDSGSVIIDGIDISTIPRHYVRSQLNDIPQEPYFLTGTVRLNADPNGNASDEQVMDALAKVQLWDIIEKKGGLEIDLDTDLLSKGQKQLFCLARAILRPGKIVILDEATSSVDIKTDELMQRIIRTEFKDHTVIAITHSLNNLAGFDRIMVLDHGVLMECDSANALLEKSSLFKELSEMYKMGNHTLEWVLGKAYMDLR